MSVKTIITDGGLELLRAAPNHSLVYTRAACGSGSVPGTKLAELTDIAGYEMDLSIVDVKPTETAATLRLQLDNIKAPREFQLFQIGVYAKLMDGDDELMGERLLQVMQYDAPDIVRAIPHVSEYVVNTLMGQAEKVEGVIDLAAYVSIRLFRENTPQIKVYPLTIPVSGWQADGERGYYCEILHEFVKEVHHVEVNFDLNSLEATAICGLHPAFEVWNGKLRFRSDNIPDTDLIGEYVITAESGGIFITGTSNLEKITVSEEEQNELLGILKN